MSENITIDGTDYMIADFGVTIAPIGRDTIEAHNAALNQAFTDDLLYAQSAVAVTNNGGVNHIPHSQYIIGTDTVNRDYASGMILDTGNPTEDVRRAFQGNYFRQPYIAPFTPDEVINLNNPPIIVGEGIAAQLNNANTVQYNSITLEEMQSRVDDLTNQYGNREYTIPPMGMGSARSFNQALQREVERMRSNNTGLLTPQRRLRRGIREQMNYNYMMPIFQGTNESLVIRETKEAPEGYKWDDEGRLEKL